jgi:pimeloyl-ACP methyl ester carboxylesterase
MDNWDPAVADPLADGREIILFENAGVGRSRGTVPTTMAGVAAHVFVFLDGLGIKTCDVLGFSLGGMVAQEMAVERPSVFRRMILVGTAPRGGADIMHLDKPRLAHAITLQGYAVLQALFIAPTDTSQKAAMAFTDRLMQGGADREPLSGPAIAGAQMAAFREWEAVSGERFASLKRIHHPTLVVNGVHDDMVPVQNSYWLSENLPNAVLLTYPDSGRGSPFHFHEVVHRPGCGVPCLRLGIRTVLRVSRSKGSRSRYRRNGGLFHGPP